MWKPIATAISLIVAVLALPITAHAAHSASCIAPEVTMLGTTYALAEGYRLTEESSETDIGGVVLERRLDLSTSFSFDMELYTGDTGSDGAGMGLTFHNDSRGKTAISSSLEESMGFGRTDAISPSLNIELDTTDNGYADISSNHWAVILDGDVRQSSSGNVIEGTTSFGYSIEDNDYYDATLDWNASTNTLTFTFNGSQLFSTVVDIPSHVGTDFPWFVITAATGNSEDNEHSACFLSEPAYAPQNYVIETADSGYNSLRAAMTYVNANSGTDNVDFYIPGTGPHVIAAGSSLPTITDAGVTIDGSTQSGASCGDLWNGDGHTLMVEIDGPGSGNGITSGAANTTVKGLSITDFDSGLVANSSSSNFVAQCNYLGLNPDGTADGHDLFGVFLQGSGALVGGLAAGEGNVVSANQFAITTAAGSSGTMIRGNFVGTNPTGTSARANTYGIGNFTGAATWSDITGNLVAGNSGSGISIDADDTVTGSSGDIVIAGNYIGLNRAGTGALSNNLGISIVDSAPAGITIGGLATSDRNVIGGNTNQGILIDGSSDIDIFGNYIGTTADGLSEIINWQQGIWLVSSSSINIGNGLSTGRNVIGSSAARAIQMESTTSNVSINGNYIGTDITGNSPMSNAPFTGLAQRDAVGLYGTLNSVSILDNVIGGFDEAAIDSDNASGSNVTIQGNNLNVGADGASDISSGTSSVDNATSSAVLMFANTNSISNLVVGGTGAGDGNIIANGPNLGAYIENSGATSFIGNTVTANGSHGVRVNGSASTSVSIMQNSIYSNGGISIDLGTDGETANDSGDGDAGPNDLLNRAVLDGMYAEGTGSLRYFVTLDAPESTNGYRIELFRTSVVNGTGAGDLEEFVLAIDTGAHAAGEATYEAIVADSASLTAGEILSATVTERTGASSYGATSEASTNITIDELYDYTDIPLTGTSYGSSRHGMNPYYYLGSVLSGDAAAFDSADAATDGDDDDGVTIPSALQGNTIQLSFDVTGDSGYLSGWIDWNGDGDFDDTVNSISETIAIDVQDGGGDDADSTVDGTILLDVTVPSSATTSQTFARFRWSADSGLDSTTDADDGEVEDFAIIISGTAVLTASRSTSVYDPSSSGLYAVPGNDMVVSTSATNIGSGSSDEDSIVFIDEVPSDLSFYNGTTADFGGNIIGWSETGSGLTFADSTDLTFSNSGTRPTGLAQCTYTPSAGYDDNVTYVCFNPKGEMQAGDPDPTFEVKYRVRIK